MVQRSLTTGVSQALYDEYRASLPEGESVNSHLRALIERWLAGPVIAPGEPPFADPVYDPDKPLTVQLPPGTVHISGAGAGAPVPSPVTVSDPGCMHPRGALKREGRNVVCSLCGRHLSVT